MLLPILLKLQPVVFKAIAISNGNLFAIAITIIRRAIPFKRIIKKRRFIAITLQEASQEDSIAIAILEKETI